MVKHCPSCGTGNNDDAKFCTGCGENISKLQKAIEPRPQHINNLDSSCLWCHQKAGYQEEEGRLDSKFGFTSHRMKIFICNNCGFAHLFGLGRSIWDFD